VVSDVDIAWLAGILEGEGSFWMSTNHVGGKVYRYPKVVVGMTDRDIIERVAGLIGGSVYDMPRQPGRKAAFRAQVSGVKAAEWMRRLYPWLGERRRAKIDEILKEYGEIEPTAVRRRRSCSEAALRRRERECEEVASHAL